MKGSGINRQTLSEKLPDCKIHSASAFETLTARKNASEWGRRERSRGGGRGVGSKKKAARFDENRPNKQTIEQQKKVGKKRKQNGKEKKGGQNARQKKDGEKKRKGRRTSTRKMFAVATDERLSRVGCDFWYTNLAGGRLENRREGRGDGNKQRRSAENSAEERRRIESERNRTTIIIVKTEYLAG